MSLSRKQQIEDPDAAEREQEALDAYLKEQVRLSLADPRPSGPVDEVLARLEALHRRATLSREDLIEALLALEPQLRAEGVTGLALFGSRARGDHRPDSDVDVAIDVEANSRFSLITLAGVARQIEARVGVPANIFMRRSLDDSFRRTLARDGIEIFG
ncbi:nucleotidyltransferase family protein [Xanthobacteraceae bacterium A53D]